ncbi:MAG TPA: TlyA family RNA methyltransferase [Dissulfurispiraceae bacterium]|nr:TlyA family RNA methyltransferase [Dissulfurispiraceae bacterium]
MKDRLDKILVERGLVQSRERAQALILEGKVFVNGMQQGKAGALVQHDAAINVKGDDIPYVSRGGLKLEAALREFSIDFTGKVAMDVGASTGGFTDCMLQRGLRKSYCIDVGYGQLAWKLQQDERVVLMDRTNIRHLEQSAIADIIDVVVIDVSFISLEKVVPAVLQFLKAGGELIALIKPQFEVGKGEVGKGGIVKDAEKRQAAVNRVCQSLESLGLRTVGVIASPILGQKGNVEYLFYGIQRAE